MKIKRNSWSKKKTDVQLSHSIPTESHYYYLKLLKKEHIPQLSSVIFLQWKNLLQNLRYNYLLLSLLFSIILMINQIIKRNQSYTNNVKRSWKTNVINKPLIEVGSASQGSDPRLGTLNFSRGNRISGPPELRRFNDLRLRPDLLLFLIPLLSELLLGNSWEPVMIGVPVLSLVPSELLLGSSRESVIIFKLRKKNVYIIIKLNLPYQKISLLDQQ